VVEVAGTSMALAFSPGDLVLVRRWAGHQIQPALSWRCRRQSPIPGAMVQGEFGIQPDCSVYSHSQALAILTGLLSGPNSTAVIAELCGERWSGKTALMEDFAKAASANGWRIAAGSAGSVPSSHPLNVFIDALSDLTDRHCEDLRRALPSHHLRPLGLLFPSLAMIGPESRRIENDEMYAAFLAVRGLIEALAAGSGLLLLLDDMHMADTASLRLLGYLFRYPPEGMVAMVVGHRPKQSHPELLSSLSTAAVNGVVRRLALGPLSKEAVFALLPGHFSYPQCAALLRESGGNPGLLTGLASLGTVHGSLDRRAARLPQRVLATCLRDFRTLSEPARQVARAVAVLEESAEPFALTYVAQVSQEQMWTAVDELAGEDLICCKEAPGRLEFVNPLLRMAAYQSAGLGWLMGAHTRAVEILTKQRKSARQVAWHVEHAPSIDDESAFWLLSAVHDYVWQNPAQTARLLRAMADFKPAGGMSHCDQGALLGKALAVSGQLIQAIEVLDWVAGQISGRNPLWADVVRWRACSRFLVGRLDDAREILSAGLAVVRPLDTEAEANLRRTRLTFALAAGTSADQSDLAYLIRYAAKAPGLEAGHTAGILAAATWHDSEALAGQYAKLAAQSFDNSTEDGAAHHLEGLYWLTRAEGLMGHYQVALQRCERGLRIAEKRQIGSITPLFAAALGDLQLRCGDLNGAARHAACARVAATEIGCAHVLELTDALEARIHDAVQDVTLRRPDAGGAEMTSAPTAEYKPAAPATSVPDPEVKLLKAKVEKLSGRETEIARLISLGKTNQQIARLLGLSHKTVETYIARIFSKLAASCRAEVAAIVSRCGSADW
jgi:DNA-binding CsgD family transcriptional regulator/tetratricopeptide (TPR) repeat protein